MHTPCPPANDHHCDGARITKSIARDLGNLSEEIDLDELRAIWCHYAPAKSALLREQLENEVSP